MRKYVSCALWVCLTLVSGADAWSQNRKIDSLLSLNYHHKTLDSVKVMLLRDIARAYHVTGNSVKTEIYVDSTLLIASKLPGKYLMAAVYNRLGALFHNTDRLRAIGYYNKSLELAVPVGFNRVISGSNLNLGALYMSMRDFPKSLENHERAIQVFAALRDTGNIASCYMNISYIYNSMGQKMKGLDYIHKALSTFEAGGSDRGVAIACQETINLLFGATDRELQEMGITPSKRLSEIASLIDKGLARSLKTDDESLISTFYMALGRLGEQRGDIASARRNYQKGVAILQDKPDEENFADNLIVSARFFLNVLNDPASASPMLHVALQQARTTSSSASEEEALNTLSLLHEKAGRFDSALFYYRKVIVIREGIFNKEKEQEITRRQLKIDFELKEKEYQYAQQLNEGRLLRQQQEIQLRNQQVQIIEKEKTLQRLTFLKEQADLQKQKDEQVYLLGRERMESQYNERLSAQQLGMKSLELETNRWLSVFFAIVALMMIVGAMLLYRSRKKTVALNKLVSQQKTALEELVDVKDKIFSVVSHDLRGPVNNIVALSSILEDGDIEQEKLAMYVQQMKQTLTHTSSLMENLLNWSASQMKGFTPEITDVDISQLTTQTLEAMSQSLGHKKIEVVNRVPAGVLARGDRNMIELILRNLVSNAVKFSRAGDVLELDAADNGRKVVLSVKDNGIGMGEAKVAHINNPVVTSVESTPGTMKEKGTGLGLMLCKHFAMMMGGNIRVQSGKGTGSLFHVYLPSATAA